MSKSKVVKVKFDEFDAEKYSLSTSEAYLLLKERGLTKADDEQVVQRWLKEGKIDSILVKKGLQTARGYRVNEASLIEYAEAKTKSRSEWKQELDAANLKIASLEAKIQALKNKKAIVKTAKPEKVTPEPTVKAEVKQPRVRNRKAKDPAIKREEAVEVIALSEVIVTDEAAVEMVDVAPAAEETVNKEN